MAVSATIASTFLEAASSYSQGRSAQRSKDAQALQMDYAAGQERAASQRTAAEQLRAARLAQSRLQALAMGGGTDVGVVNLAAGIAGEGEYRALTALYEGEERAKGMEYGADVARAEGKDAKRAGTIGAFTSILSGVGSMYEKFGAQDSPLSIDRNGVGITAGNSPYAGKRDRY